MNKLCLAAATLAALSIGLVRESRAGRKQFYPVAVDSTYRVASGVLGTARNTTDTVQYIGCTVTHYADGNATGWCSAVTAAGVAATCTTDNAALIDTMSRVRGDSYLSFAWTAGGDCTRVMLSNYSSYEPKS